MNPVVPTSVRDQSNIIRLEYEAELSEMGSSVGSSCGSCRKSDIDNMDEGPISVMDRVTACVAQNDKPEVLQGSRGDYPEISPTVTYWIRGDMLGCKAESNYMSIGISQPHHNIQDCLWTRGRPEMPSGMQP